MDGAEGHLWAVGEGGVIVHRDPTGVFDTRVWPGLPRLDGVVAITADNAWAVGEDGLVLHYLNGAWSVVQSGFVEDLRAVFAFGPGDVWVGGSGRYADAALLRNQTFGFETHTTGPVYTPLVSFIFATSPSDVFVGGLGTPAASLIHYDGSDWSYHTELLLRLPNLSLLAMAAFRSELYVSTDQQDGELYRRTSAGWESFHTDRGVDTGNQAIYDLAATNDRLLIAGHWDLVGYDGAQLTREHGTRTAGGQHCVHADASGAFLGAPGGRIYQEQASGFELAYGSPWEGVGDSAQVVARAADDLWWIGERRLHFDGLAWSAFDAPYPATAVHRGEPIYLASNAEVYRETPAGFELVATAPRELSALWVSPTGQMFAADGGALLRFDGVDWHEYGLPNPLYAHPHAIHGTADDNVWVVGSNTAVRWDGTQWNNHWDSVLDSDWLTTVHVLSPDSMWTGGANTNPHHWNGTGFESWEGSMPMWIRGIAAFADDDVWITGTENGLPAVTSHFDGTSWTVKDTGCAHPLYELHVSDANTLWAAGPGALLRWVRP